MKTKVYFLLVLIMSVSILRGTDLFEAVFSSKIDAKTGTLGPTEIKIRRLSEEKYSAVEKGCGGDFNSVPEAKSTDMPKVRYPFEMKRRRLGADVQCLVQIGSEGTAIQIYRVGTDSDLLFIECAKALGRAKFEKRNEPYFERFFFHAHLVSESPST